VDELIALRKLKRPPQDLELRLKYGCTYGKCIGGFLSPRMQLSVQTRAQECHDILSVMLRTAISTDAFLKGANAYTKYIDHSTESVLKASRLMCAGFVDIFAHFATVLDDDMVPDDAAVIAVASTDAQNFLKMPEDACRSIGSIIFKLAMNADAIAGFGP
jgi:hypothetical protein